MLQCTTGQSELLNLKHFTIHQNKNTKKSNFYTKFLPEEENHRTQGAKQIRSEATCFVLEGRASCALLWMRNSVLRKKTEQRTFTAWPLYLLWAEALQIVKDGTSMVTPALLTGHTVRTKYTLVAIFILHVTGQIYRSKNDVMVRLGGWRPCVLEWIPR